MERKSSVNEVHKVVQKDLAELYSILSNKLGQNNPFAKISIGSGYYLWSDNRLQWHQMNEATDFERSIIHDAVYKAKQEIASIFGSRTSELLFTTPDDSYIYYNDDSGDVKILITGWGFKKPVRMSTGSETGDLQKHTPINLSFSFDGVKQPMYEFGVQIPTQIKKLKTDNTGHYKFKDLKQKQLMLKDFPTGKDFCLIVEEGRSDYDFDVTIYTDLRIKATMDQSPLAGERVTVDYHGKNYYALTDANGSATVRLPLHMGERAVAALRDLTQYSTISADNNIIEFVFVNPATDIVVSVMEDGSSVEGREVAISYAGNRYYGFTDQNGVFSQHVKIVEGEYCTVEVKEYDTQSKILSNEGVNYFRFEKTNIMPDPPFDTVKFAPHILVEKESGEVAKEYPITVVYDGVTTEYVTDGNGIVKLPELEEGKVLKIIDGRNSDNVVKYDLKSEQLEYTLRVKEEEVKEEEKEVKMIKVMMRDADGKPLTCDGVRFKQGDNNELFTTLDKSGDTYFEAERFKIDDPINVSIQGGKKTYDPFTFTLDKDEYTYLLQEKNSSTWGKILLQILLLLLTIVALYYLWPVFTKIFAAAFNGIYH